MQDIQHALEPDCVNCPVGIAVKVVPYLKNSTKPLEGLCVARMIAELSLKKSLTDFGSYGGRECSQILPA